MIIKHQSFKFIKPELITENEYKTLKTELLTNPKLNITPESSFLSIYKNEIIKIIIIPIVLIVISEILYLITDWDGFETISLIVFVFICFQFFLKYIWEWFSYFNFYINKKRYYKNLKRRVLKSDNYEHMRKKYWFWVNLHLNR